MIVHYIRKVVCGIPVALHQYLVIKIFVLKGYLPVHQVFELALSTRYPHPDGVGRAHGQFLLDLVLGEALEAVTIVLDVLALELALLSFEVGEPLLSAEAVVRISILTSTTLTSIRSLIHF